MKQLKIRNEESGALLGAVFGLAFPGHTPRRNPVVPTQPCSVPTLAPVSYPGSPHFSEPAVKVRHLRALERLRALFADDSAENVR